MTPAKPPTAPAAASGAAARRAVSGLKRFLRLQGRVEGGKPTFSKFMGLAVSPGSAEDGGDDDGNDDDGTLLRGESFSVSDRSTDRRRLVFRYRFPDRLKQLERHHHQQHQQQQTAAAAAAVPGLSTYASILDDITTLGMIAAAPKNPRPGVSVVLEARRGAAAARLAGDEVDIVATVTKRGRTLGFVRAEVRDPFNEDALVCSFDHVKYLPTGRMLGLLLTPFGMRCLERIPLERLRPRQRQRRNRRREEEDDDGGDGGGEPRDDEYEYEGILDSYRATGETTATFRYGQVHANGFGGLHGGVHAILMERLGKTVARRELSKVVAIVVAGEDDAPSPSSRSSSSGDGGPLCEVDCERLKVTYQSAASTRSLDLRATVLDPPRSDRPSVTLRVEIVRSRDGDDDDDNARRPAPEEGGGGTVVSEGILTFSIASSSNAKSKL